MFRPLLLVFSLLYSSAFFAQAIPDYKNSALPIEQRVKDLIGRMTSEEKFWQLFMIPGDLTHVQPGQYQNGLFGFQVSTIAEPKHAAQQIINYDNTENAITLAKKVNDIQRYFIEHTRLGIPLIFFDEALHGLVRQGATVFPQAIGLAASFDSSLLHQVAKAIAMETKMRGIRQVLSPVINIASDVRWGRTEETYGEDPYLTTVMAIAYISAFEKAGIITTPKHFLANVGDGGRDSYPIHFNERLLKEIYLPPFRAAIEKAGARSVMTAYNSIDGSPASASKWLLTDLLKKEYGFRGFVISDAGATGGANVLHFTASDYPDAGRKSLQNGLDVIFQTQYDHYKLFIPPFLDGSIPESRIDDAVTRVLTAKFQLGLFDHPYIAIPVSDSADLKEHRALALKAAGKSIVLLQNKNELLPLHQNVQSIAVLGAEASVSRSGGYSGEGNHPISILQGIRKLAGSGIHVRYSIGATRDESPFVPIADSLLFTDLSGKANGLTGYYFRNIDCSGNPDAVRTDKSVDFNWTLYGPDNLQVNSFYSVEWKGFLVPKESGDFDIGLEGDDGFRFYINDSMVVDRWNKQSFHRETTRYRFIIGQSYRIAIRFYEPTGNAHIKLIWNAGVSDNWQRNLNDAVQLTKESDIAIIAAGITEGEFSDRAYLTLPGHQEELIRKVAATGKPVIVILTGGSAIVMKNWIDSVNSILMSWYPGDAGGEAIADAIFGKLNPAGRLPVTFPQSEAQLPLVYNHKPTGRGDDYNNLSGLPLFPFGYGLSYTNFRYSDLQMDQQSISDSGSVQISCVITNTGQRDGEEVVQCYIHDELSSVARPVMELKGFKRIALKSGEQQKVRFTLAADDFKLYNESMQWVTERTKFKIMIGASSRDIRLQTILKIE